MAVAPSPGSRARNTINVVSLESYLKGVVPLEMPATWSKAAVRAQAVAARTYAAYERAHRSGPMCDTTSCQVYGGRAAEHRDSNAAIKATRKLVLTHRGEPAFTQFSSSSGGWTSAGSMPYLRARKDPYDGWAGNPVHTWRIRVKDTLFESRWPSIGNLRRIAVRQRDGNGQWGGRIRSIAVIGEPWPRRGEWGHAAQRPRAAVDVAHVRASRGAGDHRPVTGHRLASPA